MFEKGVRIRLGGGWAGKIRGQDAGQRRKGKKEGEGFGCRVL